MTYAFPCCIINLSVNNGKAKEIEKEGIMKTAAKVFIIIGMIVGAIGILPIVFGAITLSKMGKATCKDDMVVWGVLTLLFCSLLGGIFVLCTTDADYACNVVNNAPNYVPNQTQNNASEQAASNATDDNQNNG